MRRKRPTVKTGTDISDFYRVRVVPDGESPLWNTHRGRYISRYRFVADYVRNKRVLDLACGAGYGSMILSEAGALSVIGGDIDPAVIAYACEAYRAANVRFAVVDATDMAALRSGSFDVVCSMGTIEHVRDVKLFLAEVRRVLAPQGLWFVSALNREHKSHKSRIDHHWQEYSLGEFVALLKPQFGSVELYGHDLSASGRKKLAQSRCRRLLARLGRSCALGKKLPRAAHRLLRAGGIVFEPDDYIWRNGHRVEACFEFIAICRRQ